MRICGSCYNLVSAEDKDTKCPRCLQALEPGAADTLAKFIAHGPDPTKKGVKLREAQLAASKVLGELTHLRTKLKMHHLGERCSECTEVDKPGGEG